MNSDQIANNLHTETHISLKNRPIRKSDEKEKVEEMLD